MTKSRPMAERPLFEALLSTLDSGASVRSVLIGRFLTVETTFTHLRRKENDPDSNYRLQLPG